MVRKLKIRHRILLLVLGLNLALTIIFSVYAYRNEKQVTLQGIDEKLYAGVTALVEIFPDEYHSQITGPESISDQEYLEYLRKLTSLAKENGFTYLYTYMLIGDSVVTTSTSATEEELRDSTYVRFFVPYAPSEGLRRAFAEKTVQYEEIVDEFGHFRTAFLPVQTAGGAWYVSGADISIAFIRERLRRHLVSWILVGAGVCAVFVLVSTMVGDRIARPLIALADYTKSMTETDFALGEEGTRKLTDLSERSQDEVGGLASAFLYMDKTLKKYIQDLRDTTAAKERIESELSIARDIQMSFLHKLFPPFPDRVEFDLFAALEPAREVGGDLYDFGMIDDQHLYLSVADVSDKGVPASLFMSVTQTLMRAAVRERVLDPAEILRWVNNELCEENKSQMFVTAFCAVFNFRTGDLRFANAGHNPPLLLRKKGGGEWLKLPAGMVLGVIPEFEYQSESIKLMQGDALVSYTDGVTEAMNPRRECYSEQRLLDTAAALAGHGPEEMVKALLRSVKEFAAEAPQSDDITILALEFKRRENDPRED